MTLSLSRRINWVAGEADCRWILWCEKSYRDCFMFQMVSERALPTKCRDGPIGDTAARTDKNGAAEMKRHRFLLTRGKAADWCHKFPEISPSHRHGFVADLALPMVFFGQNQFAALI